MPDCRCAEFTENGAGFGIAGGYAVTFKGFFALKLDHNGGTGNAAVNVHLDGSVGVKWPCFVYCGSGCSHVTSVSADPYLQCDVSNNHLHVHGNVHWVDGNGDSGDGSMDYTF